MPVASAVPIMSTFRVRRMDNPRLMTANTMMIGAATRSFPHSWPERSPRGRHQPSLELDGTRAPVAGPPRCAGVFTKWSGTSRRRTRRHRTQSARLSLKPAGQAEHI